MTRGMTILAGGGIAATAVNTGDGSQYLRTPDPKEVWKAQVSGTLTIYADLGAVREVDTVFLGFTDAAPGTTWRIDATSSMQGANPVELLAARVMALPAGVDPRRHGFATFQQAVQTRYLRIDLTPGAQSTFSAGVLAAGKRFDHPYEFKAGRRPIDLGERIELAGGGFGFGEGAIKSSFKFTFADLSDSAVDTLWRLVRTMGLRNPVILVEGGEGAVSQDQLHYGVFERFEAYEREDPADTRWSLSMQDWI